MSGFIPKDFGNEHKNLALSKSIVFNSHIDTVRPITSEWKTNPFDLKVEKNYSYGLGAVNCKGSAAVHLYLAKNFKRLFPNIKENIDFTFVTDEENLGPDGTKYLKKLRVDLRSLFTDNI